MPNNLAYFMLLIWPIVMIGLFRKMPVARAFIWSLLGAYLFLPPAPAGFDFPSLPPFDKQSIPNLMVLAICIFLYGKRIFSLPKSTIGKVLVALFVLSPIATVFTNSEPIVFRGAEPLPGLRVTDAIAISINQLLLLIPFLLARQMLAAPEAHKELLVALLVGGLIYSIPMLIEIRLSPQVNVWVYGFFQHSFEQTIRFGGFRPVVFLNHGLWVAFFAMTTVIAAIALWRMEQVEKNRTMYFIAAVYLGVVLILCKSTGAVLFAIFLAPLVMFATRRVQVNITFLLIILTLAYPVLKGVSLMPADALVAQAEKIGEDRAGSLRFRFYNEDLLLERANEKPLFGWGSWGRNHLHDPVSGTIQTVSDGRWIITFGVFGWIGFIAEFGLLGLPLILLWRQVRIMPPGSLPPFIGPLALILVINIVDLLPNATLTPITWIISGAMLGYAEQLKPIKPKRKIIRTPWRPIM